MASDTIALPDLTAIADRILGMPYAAYDCWGVLRFCLKEGFALTLEANPAEAMQHVQEIWWHDEGGDPLALSQPWDIWILRKYGPASSHVGLVMDAQYFLHTQERIGVCREPLARWSSRLLQIARLRHLLA